MNPAVLQFWCRPPMILVGLVFPIFGHMIAVFSIHQEYRIAWNRCLRRVKNELALAITEPVRITTLFTFEYAEHIFDTLAT